MLAVPSGVSLYASAQDEFGLAFHHLSGATHLLDALSYEILLDVQKISGSATDIELNLRDIVAFEDRVLLAEKVAATLLHLQSIGLLYTVSP
jgi:PqqD family protein of HPr-rel-A system